MTLEPIHSMVYFSPLQGEFFGALGLEGRGGYFASRSAALGAAPAELVTSTFFNFAPDLVREAIEQAWRTTTPNAVLEARYRLVEATLRAHVSDHVDSADTARAAAIAKDIALDACTRLEGRPLFAGHASLPWPDPDHSVLTLWHAQTLLREFRGDGHIAMLVSEGLSGVDAHVTHIATGDIPSGLMRATRAWSDEAFEASVDSLVARSLVVRDDDGPKLTAKGVEQRERIESGTDRLAAAPYLKAGEERCAELRRAARPLSRAIIDAGLSPLRGLPPEAADRS
jgi:hypothetical protein